MRIDKYLKLTRLVKRRTVAKELLDRELFYLNGKVAKPCKEIKVGDEIVLQLGRHRLTIEVLEIKEYVKKEDATKLYKILKDEIVNDIKSREE